MAGLKVEGAVLPTVTNRPPYTPTSPTFITRGSTGAGRRSTYAARAAGVVEFRQAAKATAITSARRHHRRP